MARPEEPGLELGLHQLDRGRRPVRDHPRHDCLGQGNPRESRAQARKLEEDLHARPLKSGKTYPYGFGWFVDEERGQLRHHHGGAWQGFETYIARYLEDDLTVILLTNLGEAEPDVFTDAIAAAINPKLGLPSQPLKDQEDAIGKRVRTLIARRREHAHRRGLRCPAGRLLPDPGPHYRNSSRPG